MCGIIGILITDSDVNVGQSLADVLTILQHRGQDAAGIVTASKDGRLKMIKDNGPVSDVFTQKNIATLTGSFGIGHVRYPTAGGSCQAEAQPLYTNVPFGIALAHNGNLTNTEELYESMLQDHRHINTDSDSELLLNVFAEELQRQRLCDLSSDDLFSTVRGVMRRCKGAYSAVVLVNGVGLIGFRDPHGIRPLCFGVSRDETGRPNGYAIGSESVSIDAVSSSFALERDVAPGEAVFISTSGEMKTQICHTDCSLSPCIFEYVYFARADSILDGVCVYEARLNMGEKLANKILSKFPDHDIDVVIPIPDTSRTSALQCAYKLGKPYTEGFIKNRYIHRTFIMPVPPSSIPPFYSTR
jgi:amidophosphoribosyltransferase